MTEEDAVPVIVTSTTTPPKTPRIKAFTQRNRGKLITVGTSLATVGVFILGRKSKDIVESVDVDVDVKTRNNNSES